MREREQEYVEFDNVKCKAATDKAYLLVIEGEEVWIPKSQMNLAESDEVTADPRERFTVHIAEWLCIQKNLC